MNPKFEPKLEFLHNKKGKLRSELKKHDNEVQQHLEVDSLKREKDKTFLFVYKVNKKGEAAVNKAEKQGYTVLLSSKTGVKFRTPTLKTLCEKLQEVNSEYATTSLSVVKQIMEVVGAVILASRSLSLHF